AARLAAAKALAPRPDATWRALVDDLARSDDPDIRLGAAGLLIEVDADRARDVLSDLAQSQNAAIREQAGQQLAAAVSHDLPALRQLLRSRDLMTQVQAARGVLELTR
ncbi:MAG: hypothetical protein R2752_23610, partial [Vicinamibacterales bacterium]